MRAYFGLTGTPGTGKKTLAPLVGRELGVQFHGLNDLAKEWGVARKSGADSEVDARVLGRMVTAKVRGPCLLFGHLLPYAFESSEFSRVTVLRCDPAVLRRRLAARGYAEEKIRENVEAELIGVLSADAVAAFGAGRVSEADTSSASPAASAAAVCSSLRSTRGRAARVDWMDSYDSAAKLRSLLGSGTPSART